MRDYSEFVQFVVEKSGLRKPLLVEKDVLLHTLETPSLDYEHK